MTGALSVAPIEYGVLTVQEGKPAAYVTKAVDVSAWAAGKGLESQELLQFAAYAQDYFDRITLSQVSTLLDSMGIPEENLQTMKALAVRLNQEYFAGTRRESELDEDIELWRMYAPLNFFTWYLDSIIDEKTPMNTYTFHD